MEDVHTHINTVLLSVRALKHPLDESTPTITTVTSSNSPRIQRVIVVVWVDMHNIVVIW